MPNRDVNVLITVRELQQLQKFRSELDNLNCSPQAWAVIAQIDSILGRVRDGMSVTREDFLFLVRTAEQEKVEV